MRFRLYIIFIFLKLTFVARASHATSPLPSQIYWNFVLQDSPMPKALNELIQPDVIRPAQAINSYSDYYQGDGTNSTLLEDPKGLFFFFFEKDMHPRTTIKLSLARNTTSSTFLSKKTAEEIPFSPDKLPEILQKFSIKPGSSQAHIMKETIDTCARKALKGEDKQCVTSLESMVDFVTSKLGRNVRAVSTEVENGATLQNYTITRGVNKLADADEDKLIVCHRKGYGYAVFYCHTFGKISAYLVPMEGSDMKKARAVAICHLDTSEWKPNVLLMLRVKPGTIPVCHFILEGDIAWISKQKPT